VIFDPGAPVPDRSQSGPAVAEVDTAALVTVVNGILSSEPPAEDETLIHTASVRGIVIGALALNLHFPA